MIKVGITNDYKSITQNLNCNSLWVDSIQVIFDADCPQKLLNDLHENPVDVLFASHHLIYYITVAFYGQLKKTVSRISEFLF